MPSHENGSPEKEKEAPGEGSAKKGESSSVRDEPLVTYLTDKEMRAVRKLAFSKGLRGAGPLARRLGYEFTSRVDIRRRPPEGKTSRGKKRLGHVRSTLSGRNLHRPYPRTHVSRKRQVSVKFKKRSFKEALETFFDRMDTTGAAFFRLLLLETLCENTEWSIRSRGKAQVICQPDGSVEGEKE